MRVLRMLTYIRRTPASRVVCRCARVYLSLRNASTGQALGWLAPLDVSSGNSKSLAGQVWTLCLGFNGSYRDRAGRTAWLAQGSAYRLVAVLTGPLAAGDAALGGKAKNTTVRRPGCAAVLLSVG